MSEVKEKLKFGAEVEKLLHLVIHSLYAVKDIFLRELVSNASDACDKLRFASLTDPSLLEGESNLEISLAIDEKAGTLTVSDNGVGMSRDELVENLGTIAKSGTALFLQNLPKDGKGGANLIGQFGVGFYSSFMVADKVTVISRKAGEKAAYGWESSGTGDFSVWEEETPRPRGTSVTLQIKTGEEQYLDKFRLKHIVKTYSDHIAFPVMLDGERINSASALWTRPRQEITTEQYKEFYRHVSHQPDEPYLILHNRNEGKIEFTSLLFAPSKRPFDMFHPDRKKRVKLFVRRVFIADEGVDVIPAWLRFLRGVVDSEDLPLNVSRETLQANPIVEKIRKSIKTRVLSELKKKSEEESYADFWNNFGPVIKEGLCDGFEEKEPILEICRFHSTNGDKLTGLDEYISRMKPDQEAIYYLSGESVDSVKNSPQLEGFAAKGIEVLLFADPVDDFWVNVVHEYKGKELKSITRADVEPEKPHGEGKETATLIAFLKTELGEKVEDVRATAKLTGSPVCLAAREGAMDIRMERFLAEQNQLGAVSAKILEINPDHAIIKSLSLRLAQSGARGLEDFAHTLLDMALITAGDRPADPKSFAERLNKMMEKLLA